MAHTGTSYTGGRTTGTVPKLTHMGVSPSHPYHHAISLLPLARKLLVESDIHPTPALPPTADGIGQKGILQRSWVEAAQSSNAHSRAPLAEAWINFISLSAMARDHRPTKALLPYL